MDQLGCESSGLKESQALNQFREWIEKHPKIKKCRKDDQFLIRFLRVRKFNISEACQLLENYLTTRKKLPHVFENLNITCPKLEGFVTSHCTLQLPQEDSQGRNVFLFDPGKFNAKQWDAIDCMRMANLAFEHISFDKRSQTKGFVVVVNFSKESFDFLRLWTPIRLKEIARCLQKTFPMRIEKIYFINMSPLGTTVLELVKTFLSSKIKKRIEVVKQWDQVFQELGSNIFPQEVGGEIPALEMANNFKKCLLKSQENFSSLSDLDIEISASSLNFNSSSDAELDAGIVGSFRKIELD